MSFSLIVGRRIKAGLQWTVLLTAAVYGVTNVVAMVCGGGIMTKKHFDNWKVSQSEKSKHEALGHNYPRSDGIGDSDKGLDNQFGRFEIAYSIDSGEEPVPNERKVDGAFRDIGGTPSDYDNPTEYFRSRSEQAKIEEALGISLDQNREGLGLQERFSTWWRHLVSGACEAW